MNCKDVFKTLSDFMDGEVGDNICEQIKWHLENCSPCESLEKTLRKTIEVLKACPRESMPEGLREEIRSMIRSEMERPPSSG